MSSSAVSHANMCYMQSARVQHHEVEDLLSLRRRLGLALPGEQPGEVGVQ